MKQALVQGQVLAQFVVDTFGAVEAATIRVLAETSELPAVVRMDAAARRAAQAPVAVGRPVTLPAREDPQIRANRRLRRTRLLASLLLLASIAIGVLQIVSAGPWLVVAAAAVTALCSLALLGRLAEVSRSRRAPVARSRRTTVFADHAPVAAQPAEWTPVPLPKPMYLSRSQAPAAAVTDPAFELHLAAASAEHALRSIDQPPAIADAAGAAGGTPIRSSPAPSPVASPQSSPKAAPSRVAQMGIVDDAGAAPDIDAALARRRA